MYLIHAGLRAPSGGGQLPVRAAESMLALAETDVNTPVEHVSAHAHALPDPVVGVYVLAENLEAAERAAEVLCRRAVEEVRALRGWTVTRVGAPLVAPYYEHLLKTSSGLAGRIGTGPFPSI
ncbi:hypothetical protein OOK31_32895 [Streptomyces sp. NBC_00249]|uniref:hypothetical protein n=1 Tax=Streptomyces sp. NBC_00249 TaxID=2975690 RepID=UPI002252FD52|nr:hypothetical protein [Streptomyces sp. NBC_00249]MCX5198630.1 hypothetical protein [Streptomyces sp. NBC_00249]